MSISVETYALAKKNAKKQIDEALTSIYEYKGSVQSLEDLPLIGNKVGDTYNVIDEGGQNYGWTGTEWDSMGVNQDASTTKKGLVKLATAADVDNKDSNKVVTAKILSDNNDIINEEIDILQLLQNLQLASFQTGYSNKSDVMLPVHQLEGTYHYNTDYTYLGNFRWEYNQEYQTSQWDYNRKYLILNYSGNLLDADLRFEFMSYDSSSYPSIFGYFREISQSDTTKCFKNQYGNYFYLDASQLSGENKTIIIDLNALFKNTSKSYYSEYCHIHGGGLGKEGDIVIHSAYVTSAIGESGFPYKIFVHKNYEDYSNVKATNFNYTKGLHIYPDGLYIKIGDNNTSWKSFFSISYLFITNYSSQYINNKYYNYVDGFLMTWDNSSSVIYKIKIHDYSTSYCELVEIPNANNVLTKNNIVTYTPSGNYNPATKKYVDDKVSDIDLSSYLAKNNTTEFNPTGDYNPATKKYVDEIPKMSDSEVDSIFEEGIKKDDIFSFTSENFISAGSHYHSTDGIIGYIYTVSYGDSTLSFKPPSNKYRYFAIKYSVTENGSCGIYAGGYGGINLVTKEYFEKDGYKIFDLDKLNINSDLFNSIYVYIFHNSGSDAYLRIQDAFLTNDVGFVDNTDTVIGNNLNRFWNNVKGKIPSLPPVFYIDGEPKTPGGMNKYTDIFELLDYNPVQNYEETRIAILIPKGNFQYIKWYNRDNLFYMGTIALVYIDNHGNVIIRHISSQVLTETVAYPDSWKISNYDSQNDSYGSVLSLDASITRKMPAADSSFTPTNNNHLTTKKYVDELIKSLQHPIIATSEGGVLPTGKNAYNLTTHTPFDTTQTEGEQIFVVSFDAILTGALENVQLMINNDEEYTVGTLYDGVGTSARIAKEEIEAKKFYLILYNMENATYHLIADLGREKIEGLPAHTSADADKVLTIDEYGNAVWKDAQGGEVPAPTLQTRGGIYAQTAQDTSGMQEVVIGSDEKAYTDISAKENKTTIVTNSTDATATITLANNTEYRFTQDLSSLTLTLPQSIDNTFIASIVFSSGSTATAMTYDSSIKWSGDDVTSGSFVPQASKVYNVVMWYDGINVNAVVRGV